MVKKEIVDRICAALPNTANIRNISVIAHVDHGKSTLTDSLIFKAGLMSQDSLGQKRFMDTRKDEQKRTITIKSTSVAMVFDVVPPKPKTIPVKGEWKPRKHPEPESATTQATEPASAAKVEATQATEPFLLNLIDSPGHVDFSSEVTAALRVTDGALVVVDCVEGVRVQTETVLRQAMAERIKPVLFLNKLDRLFQELKKDPEKAYQDMSRAIESVNAIVSTSRDDLLGDVTVWPQNGTVAFGSGLQGWGFTLETFAEMFNDKFGLPKRKMMKKLWGDNFWDPIAHKWTTSAVSSSGKPLERGFNFLVFRPLQTLFNAVLSNDTAKYTKFLQNCGVVMTQEQLSKEPKLLLKAILQQWIPASDALLSLIVNHLPSPLQAQQYRVSNLYAGPLDDQGAEAIRRCDPDGPTIVYVSKMVPADQKRFFSFGRVFSGTVRQGQRVRVQGPDFVFGQNNDLRECNLQGVVVMMGPSTESALNGVPCGNTVGLVGIDHFLVKSGTITTLPMHNFVSMKYSVSPIVRVAVNVVNPAQLPKLTEGLRRLVKSDPLVVTFLSPSKEHIVAGCGELHLEVCLKDLQEDFLHECPIKISEPVVSFCETVTQDTEAGVTILAKSANKHNRVYASASPLTAEFCDAVDDKKIVSADGNKASQAAKLTADFDWDLADTKKIWCFGLPPDSEANVLVDQTRGVQYLTEGKDSICGGFYQASSSGVFCGEPLRGVRFNLLDVKLHPDSNHRNGTQLLPAARRAFAASTMKAGPRLLEPLYKCSVTVPRDHMDGVYTTLRQRRASIEGSDMDTKDGMEVIEAFLPVSESFGFTELLRRNTGGKAFPQLSFSHWSILEGDLNDPASRGHQIMLEVRKRKGLKSQPPQFSDLCDRL